MLLASTSWPGEKEVSSGFRRGGEPEIREELEMLRHVIFHELEMLRHVIFSHFLRRHVIFITK